MLPSYVGPWEGAEGGPILVQSGTCAPEAPALTLTLTLTLTPTLTLILVQVGTRAVEGGVDRIARAIEVRRLELERLNC